MSKSRKIASRVVKGIKRVGRLARRSVSKGVEGIYDTMSDTAKEARKAMPFRARSRARALAGGRRTRRRRTRKSRR
jgi:hypothetical protein